MSNLGLSDLDPTVLAEKCSCLVHPGWSIKRIEYILRTEKYLKNTRCDGRHGLKTASEEVNQFDTPRRINRKKNESV